MRFIIGLGRFLARSIESWLSPERPYGYSPGQVELAARRMFFVNSRRR